MGSWGENYAHGGNRRKIVLRRWREGGFDPVVVPKPSVKCILIPVVLFQFSTKGLDFISLSASVFLSVGLHYLSHSVAVIAVFCRLGRCGPEVAVDVPIGMLAFVGDPGVDAGFESRFRTRGSFLPSIGMTPTCEGGGTTDTKHLEAADHGGSLHATEIWR
jgi:hypothetical protein